MYSIKKKKVAKFFVGIGVGHHRETKSEGKNTAALFVLVYINFLLQVLPPKNSKFFLQIVNLFISLLSVFRTGVDYSLQAVNTDDYCLFIDLEGEGCSYV